jgi:uncharacterized damage-inducible protein DinB
MNGPRRLVIAPLPGFSPAVGQLVSILTWTRHATLGAVHGLTTASLDHQFDDRSNSIGALLMHIAAVEFSYTIATIEERPPTPEELAEWDAGLELGERGRREIKGKDLGYYISRLDAARQNLLAALAACDDEWLYCEKHFRDQTSNNYFAWFHVIEDEIGHRGQIRWLRKRLPETEAPRPHCESLG